MEVTERGVVTEVKEEEGRTVEASGEDEPANEEELVLKETEDKRESGDGLDTEDGQEAEREVQNLLGQGAPVSRASSSSSSSSSSRR